MGLDVEWLRERASECRAVAKGVRCGADASLLEDLAYDLEDEARRLDADSRDDSVRLRKGTKRYFRSAAGHQDG